MRYRFLIGLICALLVLGQSALLSEERPLLYGKVVKNSKSSATPLARAQIELLVRGTGKVRYTAYSDPRGGYAFRGVTPGQYDLRVSYGRVLQQETSKGWVEKRPVDLDRQPSRLIVRVRAR